MIDQAEMGSLAKEAEWANSLRERFDVIPRFPESFLQSLRGATTLIGLLTQAALFPIEESEISKWREIIGRGKIGMVTRTVINILNQESSPVVVVGYRLEVIEHIARQLRQAGVNADSSANRVGPEIHELIDDFNDGKLDALVVDFAAIQGQTFTGSDHLVFAEIDWDHVRGMAEAIRSIRRGQNTRTSVNCIAMGGGKDSWVGEFEERDFQPLGYKAQTQQTKARHITVCHSDIEGHLIPGLFEDMEKSTDDPMFVNILEIKVIDERLIRLFGSAKCFTQDGWSFRQSRSSWEGVNDPEKLRRKYVRGVFTQIRKVPIKNPKKGQGKFRYAVEVETSPGQWGSTTYSETFRDSMDQGEKLAAEAGDQQNRTIEQFITALEAHMENDDSTLHDLRFRDRVVDQVRQMPEHVLRNIFHDMDPIVY